MSVEARPGLIGAKVPRREDPRLLTGHGAFVDDRKEVGMLHVAFLRSDMAHAKIIAIDTAAANDMPGVAAVVSAADIAADAAPLRATSRMADYHATELPVLARDKVRYVGEPVVAVVADSRARAEDAVEQIVIDYDPLDAPTDPEQSAEPSAARLHDDAPSNVILSRQFTRGDVDEAMATAHLKVGGRFRNSQRRERP
jgi:carbon-monoxide dehydrogenase large subunit